MSPTIPVDDDFNPNVEVAKVIGLIIAVAVIGVIAGPALAPALPALQIISRAAAVGGAVGVASLANADDGVDQQCNCEPRRIEPRRGGRSFFTARHNACANVWTDPEWRDADVKVGDVNFDGLMSPRVLIEVKTGRFYGTIKSLPNITPARQRFLDFMLMKAVVGYYRERIQSGVCAFEFRYGASDPFLLGDMYSFFERTGADSEALRLFPNGCP